MPTIVEKSIGIGGAAAGRDYSTLQAWEDACPANLVTADQVWKGVCYNDGEFFYTTGGDFGHLLSIAGITADATRYLWLTVAPGHSIFDNVDNPLRYDPTKGVGFRRGGPGATQNSAGHIVFNQTVSNVVMERIQFEYTTSPGAFTYAVKQEVGGCRTSYCLISCINNKATPVNAYVANIHHYGGSIDNCVLINEFKGTENAPIIANITNGAPIRYCTFIARGNSNVFAVNAAYNANVFTNCAIFGCNSLIKNSPAASSSSSYNITDGPFVIPGTNNKYGAKFTDCFNSYQDLRPKKNSPLAYGGLYNASYKTDPYGIVRTPGLVSIGAIQYVETGKIPFEKFDRALSQLNWANPILSRLGPTRLGVAAVADNRGTKYVRTASVVNQAINLVTSGDKVFGTLAFGINLSTGVPVWGQQFGGGNHSAVVTFLGGSVSTTYLELFNGSVADRPLVVSTDASNSLIITSSGQTILATGSITIISGVEYTLVVTVSGTTWNIWLNNTKIIDNITVANSNGRETGSIEINNRLGALILVRNYILNATELTELIKDPYQFFKRVNPINTRIFEKQEPKKVPIIVNTVKAIDAPLLIESHLTNRLSSGIMPRLSSRGSSSSAVTGTAAYYDPVDPGNTTFGTHGSITAGSVVPSEYGPAMSSANSSISIGMSGWKYAGSTGGGTLLSLFSTDSVQTTSRIITSIRNGGGGWTPHHIQVGDGVNPLLSVNVFTGGGSTNSGISTNYRIEANKLYCVVSSYSDVRGHFIAVNGQLLPETVAATGPYMTGDILFATGGAYTGVAGGVKCYMTFVWSRALSRQELIEVSANPWKLFGTKHTTYFLPSSLNRSPIKARKGIPIFSQPQNSIGLTDMYPEVAATSTPWLGLIVNNVVSGSQWATWGTPPVLSSGAYGVAIDSTANWGGLRITPTKNPGTTNETHILIAEVTAVTGLSAGLFSVNANNGANNIYTFQRDGSNSSWCLRTGSGGDAVVGTIADSALGQTFSARPLIFGRSQTRCVVYSQGKKLLDVSHNAAGASGSSITLFGERTTSTTFATKGKIYLYVSIPKLLSDEQLKSLSLNPWQIFKPDSQIYIQPSLQREIGKPIPILNPKIATQQPQSTPIIRETFVRPYEAWLFNQSEVGLIRGSRPSVEGTYTRKNVPGGRYVPGGTGINITATGRRYNGTWFSGAGKAAYLIVMHRDGLAETNTSGSYTFLAGQPGAVTLYGYTFFPEIMHEIYGTTGNNVNRILTNNTANFYNRTIVIAVSYDKDNTENTGYGTVNSQGNFPISDRLGNAAGNIVTTSNPLCFGANQLGTGVAGNWTILSYAMWRDITPSRRQLQSLVNNPWELFDTLPAVSLTPSIQTVLKKLRRRIMLIS